MPFQGKRHNRGAGRQRPAPLCLGHLLLTVLLALPPASNATQTCPADRIDERVRISFVQDGDTLMLNDGRRLRLIGIDTPELGKSGDGAEPGAIAARDRLRQLLFISRQQLNLRFDQERTDRYGRLLAHAYLSDNRDLTEQLLSEGMGTHIVVPPNTWQSSCYHQAAQAARQQGRGIWVLPDYQAKSVTELNLKSTGFHIVRGRVTHLSNSADAIWINLDGDFALRIERGDLGNFKSINLDALVGSEIEAQGWIYASKGKLRMPLRHQDALTLVIPPSPPAQSSSVQ